MIRAVICYLPLLALDALLAVCGRMQYRQARAQSMAALRRSWNARPCFRKTKALLWKLRFTWSIHRRAAMPLNVAWDFAGANLENLNGDTSYSPLDAVQDEIDAWAECVI